MSDLVASGEFHARTSEKLAGVRSASRNAALHAGHRRVFLRHEALERCAAERLRKAPVDEVCISVITKSELLYGVEIFAAKRQDDGRVRVSAYVECWTFP